jgi:metal-sulfur cluster biosynthetic enzyme
VDVTSLHRSIVDALRDVADPCCRERGISVVDMGLLHDVSLDDTGHARVEVLLTSGWCPFQVDLVAEIEAAVRAVPDVRTAEVSITLEEAWSTSRLSPGAAAKLRFLPDPAQVDDPVAWARQPLPVVATAREPREEPPR